MRLNIAGVITLGLIAALSGCSSVSQPRQGEPLLTRTAVVSAQATVVGINHASREVTLEVPGKQGATRVDVTVSDEVKNLSQVRPGDRVTVEYIEAVFIDLFRAGEVEPGVNVTVAAASAPPGARPAATTGIEKSVTAVIDGIDNENELVALELPDGIKKIVKVRNPGILDRLSVGDKVKISFVRAWALDVTPGPST